LTGTIPVNFQGYAPFAELYFFFFFFSIGNVYYHFLTKDSWLLIFLNVQWSTTLSGWQPNIQAILIIILQMINAVTFFLLFFLELTFILILNFIFKKK